MERQLLYEYMLKAKWITQILKQKKELDISNEKLAALSRVDVQTIIEIENDEIIASFDIILKIAFALGLRARLEST